eukprot:TRINITY_DN9642_c0_g1_i1.p1 TRINITY_DN9642_c0_g1~~TRINITY_DN9642_c0_g1_i1.p1  ORF type:complete len:474 (+),score=111.94 TRINITY_DN9642_c0_g1_i1:24-1424(+)
MDEVDLSFEDLTFGTDDQAVPKEDKDVSNTAEEEPEIEDNVILVASAGGGKAVCPFDAVVKALSEKLGEESLKHKSYREKQPFGFIQLSDAQTMEKAIEFLNDFEVDGAKISAEVTAKVTAGRDPRTHDFNSDYKNTTLVFKNLPFQLRLEQLEAILAEFETKPVNVSYLYDSAGMFRGMAFVKYRVVSEALKVFELLNNRDIQGRKLRIEYKRKAKEAETNVEEDSKRMMEQLLTFSSGGSSVPELAFPCSGSYQRKQIHHFAEKLGLGHYSVGEGTDQKYVIVKKKETPVNSVSASPSKSQPIKQSAAPAKGRKNSSASSYENKPKFSYDNHDNVGSVGKSSFERGAASQMSRSHSERERGNSQSFGRVGSPNVRSPPMYTMSPSGGHSYGHSHGNSFNSNNHLSTSFGTSPSSASYGTSPNFRSFVREGPTVSPSRQPRGPDNTAGFSTEYKETRKSLKKGST